MASREIKLSVTGMVIVILIFYSIDFLRWLLFNVIVRNPVIILYVLLDITVRIWVAAPK
jgi:hypothetical protein